MEELNIKNRTIFCKDNLDILEGINSNSIDLIYLDPPFNKNKVFTAPIGTSAEGASFSDIFREEDVKDEWLKTIEEDHDEPYKFLCGIKNRGNKYNFCYLCYMAIRLIECQRILKDTGSLYLHCDPTMSHYLKLLLDVIFGEKNFRNEIIWHYYNKMPTGGKVLDRQHDIIFHYTLNKKYTLNRVEEKKDKVVPIALRKKIDGKELKMRDEKGNLIYKTFPTKKISDVWKIPFAVGGERTGYPTQKPLVLIHRIIEASSKEGDIVLDPFCGCATTCVASEQLGRKWIGIDVSIKAYELVKKRLKKEVKKDLLEPNKEVNFLTDTPKRTDTKKDDRLKKWIYVISNPAYKGEYKIGIAKYVEARLNSYQTSDPNRSYKLEYKLETPYFREIEKFIHSKFENNHEWVKADLTKIVAEIKNYKE